MPERCEQCLMPVEAGETVCRDCRDLDAGEPWAETDDWDD